MRREPMTCLLLAQSGHPDTLNQCPLLGVNRTLRGRTPMSAFDPKRAFPSSPWLQSNTSQIFALLNSTEARCLHVAYVPNDELGSESGDRAQCAAGSFYERYRVSMRLRRRLSVLVAI